MNRCRQIYDRRKQRLLKLCSLITRLKSRINDSRTARKVSKLTTARKRTPNENLVDSVDFRSTFSYVGVAWRLNKFFLDSFEVCQTKFCPVFIKSLLFVVLVETIIKQQLCALLISFKWQNPVSTSLWTTKLSSNILLLFSFIVRFYHFTLFNSLFIRLFENLFSFGFTRITFSSLFTYLTWKWFHFNEVFIGAFGFAQERSCLCNHFNQPDLSLINPLLMNYWRNTECADVWAVVDEHIVVSPPDVLLWRLEARLSTWGVSFESGR